MDHDFINNQYQYNQSNQYNKYDIKWFISRSMIERNYIQELKKNVEQIEMAFSIVNLIR